MKLPTLQSGGFKTWLQPLHQHWQQLSRREHLMLAGAATAALAAVLHLLLTAPMEKRIQQSKGQVKALQAQLQSQAEQRIHTTPSPMAREREALLRQRLQAANAAVQTGQARLGEAARLPQMLRAITATVGSARVLAIELGADPALQNEAAAASAAAAPASRRYRLPITLKVAGSYSDLQALLLAIEQHAQALQWQHITLDNARWPAIELTLKAHVLSREPRWGAS